jgi:hypothetical protein
MNSMRLRNTRTRQVPATWLHRTTKHLTKERQRYIDTIAQLYNGIQSVSGCNVIVDASRSISYAHLLESYPGINLYVVHLVRDPRAVAYSWTRKRMGTTATRTVELKQHKPLRVALEWTFQNAFSELSWGGRPSYLRLRYEDFIANPTETVRQILTWIHEPVDNLGFIQHNEVNLKVCHSAAGNMYRLKTGWVPLKLDNEWETALSHQDRVVVNSITWPWCARYGYPLNV